MRQTDQMLARYAAEIEEKQSFVDGLVEAAEKEQRDLTTQEMELVTRTRDRLSDLSGQVEPLKEARRISSESAAQVAELHKFMGEPGRDRPAEVEYRSAGAYVLDYWKAALGAPEAHERLDLFQRAAAHQTTADNPGLLPEQLIAPVVNFVDESRPLVNALGAKALPSGSWSRPRITQHTQVAPQAGEKQELASRKMTIGKVPVTATTYGGYVNVSRQDADWTQPSIMDLIISDLAGQYAIETENAAADALATAATAGATLPATPSVDDVAGAFWAAAGAVFAATKGAGRVFAICGVDMLGALGPMFAPVNPVDAQSSGFRAADFSTGLVGSIAGIPVYVSAGIDAKTILVLSSAAAEVYEDRVGALQVVEPSVLGVQVAYAGYFAPLALEAAAIIKVTAT